MIHATVTVSRKPSVGVRTPKHIHVTNAIRDIKAVTSAPYYDGAYEFTPTQETQTIEIDHKTATQDIIINPIPWYYGLITWDGSALTVS